MAAGVKHYFKDGKEHKGATHKDAKGPAQRTRRSKNLFMSQGPQSLGRISMMQRSARYVEIA
jgi:hypothetical protein